MPGARVKVRFAGQDVDGFVLERADAHRAHRPAGAAAAGRQRRAGADPGGRRPGRRGRRALRRGAVRRAAAGRAAAARHHREAAVGRRRPSPPGGAGRRAGPATPTARPSSATSPTAGAPRAVWSTTPGDDWPTLLADAAAATLASGRGSIICVPDGKDVVRVDAALTAVLGAGHHVALTAESGPAARYRDFLRVVRGACRVVVGTRACRLRPGPRPRPGGGLGRRRRPPRRAAGALPARPRGAAAALRARAGGRARRRLLAQRRGRLPDARRVGPRAGGASRAAPVGRHGGHRRRQRLRPAARPARRERPHPEAGPRPREGGAARGPGARPDPARRLRPRARLRALPDAGAVRHLRRAARAHRPDHPAGLPLVLDPGRRLDLPRVRCRRAPRAGARRGPHRRGARPVVPPGAGAHLGGRPRARHRGRRAGDRRGHPRRRAGRRGWLRGRRPARHLAAAGARRPARGRGGVASLERGCRAGPAGRPGDRRRRPLPPRTAGPRARATRPGSPVARPPSGTRRGCLRPPAWPSSPVGPARSTTR